jgi:hypothetical protein
MSTVAVATTYLVFDGVFFASPTMIDLFVGDVAGR